MSKHNRGTGRLLPAGFLLLLVTWPLGCGGPYVSAPVDPDKARDTLKRAMDGWKQGETPEALQQQNPSIVVQDFDWTGGFKLLDYEVLEQGKAVDANLVAQVKLTLQNPQGTQVEKTVRYVVGTSPVLTVFRDAFQ